MRELAEVLEVIAVSALAVQAFASAYAVAPDLAIVLLAADLEQRGAW